MPLEAKGTIKYEVGAKEPYSLKSQAMGLEVKYKQEPLSIDVLLETLEEKIQQEIQVEFARPVHIILTGFSLNAVFEVEGIPNRTLDEFTREHSSDDDDTKITVTGPDGKSVETTPKRVALAAKVMEKSRETGIPPEEILAAAKKKAAKGGAGE